MSSFISWVNDAGISEQWNLQHHLRSLFHISSRILIANTKSTSFIFSIRCYHMMSSKGKLMLVGSVNFFLLQSTLQVVSTYHSYVAFKPWHITRHKTVVVDMKKYHRYTLRYILCLKTPSDFCLVLFYFARPWKGMISHNQATTFSSLLIFITKVS